MEKMEIENFVESVKDIEFNDIIKLQIINCLAASRDDNVMKLINAVGLLEMLLLDDIGKNSEYGEKINNIITEMERRFPAYRTNMEQYEMFSVELARQKFGLLVLIVKKKAPVVIEIEDTRSENENDTEHDDQNNPT